MLSGTEAGSAHTTYFGNTDWAPGSVPATAATSGNSTCAGGTINRSSYWVSTLYDPGTERAVPIKEMSVFYGVAQLSEEELARLEPFPPGFAFAYGNPAANGPDEATGTVIWYCTAEGIDEAEKFIRDCPAGSDLEVRFRLPHCWNGSDVSNASADLRSSFPNTACPDSHPRTLPAIRVSIVYDVADIENTSRLRVANDDPSGEVGGVATTIGVVHGWQDDAFQSMVDACLKPSVDCHINILSPETALTMPPR